MCILTYVGRGYTPSFVSNLDNVVDSIRSGTEVLIMEGPDDICSVLDKDERHCERSSVTERDQAAIQALQGSLDEGSHAGEPFRLSPAALARMRDGYLGTREQTCGGCEWYELCGAIAHSEFAGTKLTC